MKTSLKLLLVALATGAGMTLSAGDAAAQTPCPAGKVCGLTQQDSTAMVGNRAIIIGKSNSTATVCQQASVVQSIVIVSPTGGQAAVLATGAKTTEDNPGTRVTLEVDLPNDCVDASTGIAYRQWQGTAQ